MKSLNKLFTDNGTTGTVIQYIAAAALLILVLLLSTSVYRGWATWWVNLPALAVIFSTAVARMYDISSRSKRWFVRRMGFVLVGASVLASFLAPIMGYAGAFPSWRGVLYTWGLAACWLTTPGQPPWWKYISSRDKVHEPEVHDDSQA